MKPYTPDEAIIKSITLFVQGNKGGVAITQDNNGLRMKMGTKEFATKDRWNHILVSYNNAERKLYLNYLPAGELTPMSGVVSLRIKI